VSRREAVLSAAAVFAVAVVARVLVASIISFPKPEDTAYYVDVARNLVGGRGLTTDALWSYQTPPLIVPRPAFEVWLPLPTYLAAFPMAILGATFAAAQWSSIVVGAIVAVLAWRLAADVAAERGLPAGRARTLAIGAGVTTAVAIQPLLYSALPDSTMPFAALTLAACLVMPRILRQRAEAPLRSRVAGLTALGLLLGLAALTRNEAAWLALVWVGLVLATPAYSHRDRLRLIALPGAIALGVFAPWAIRDWLVFGSPLPGQALTNALSVQGTDIFAWSDPPTLGRYLAVGARRLVEMRVDAVLHNLLSVLLIPGAPLSFIGFVALPWVARGRALRPLLIVSVVTFLVTALLFPIATTWGTYLHASGAAHVLLIVSALLALDTVIARAGRWRGWTRPVAWLAPTLTAFGALLFSVAFLPFFGGSSGGTARQFEALREQMAAAGLALGEHGPVITDYPIWLSYTSDANGLALPAEPPTSVVGLARAFGATTVVTSGGNGVWPAVLEDGGPMADCFDEVRLPAPARPELAEALAGTRVFRVVCP
jgi:hypothetical protein